MFNLYSQLSPFWPSSPHFLFGKVFVLFLCVQCNSVGKAGSHCLATKGTHSRPLSVCMVPQVPRWGGGLSLLSLGRETNVLCLATGSLDWKISHSKEASRGAMFSLRQGKTRVERTREISCRECLWWGPAELQRLGGTLSWELLHN